MGNCGTEQDPQQAITVGFVGDIFLGPRAVAELTGNNPNSTAAATLQDTLALLERQTDALIGNLEGALTKRKERAFPDELFAHRMDPRAARLLKGWGFDGVTLANNHTMDFGADGLADTKRALEQVDLLGAGAGLNRDQAEQPMAFVRNGIKVHILSFNATFPQAAWAGDSTPGVAYPHLDRLRRRVDQSAREADLVVTAFHWGQEGSRELRGYQSIMAQAAIEAGADFVFGHHSHAAQPVTSIEGAPVAFGIGNFVFDSFSHRAHFGLAALVRACGPKPDRPPLIGGRRPSTHPLEVVYVPLNTNNFATRFGTAVMTEAQLRAAASPYMKEKAFPKEMTFWLPNEGKLLKAQELSH